MTTGDDDMPTRRDSGSLAVFEETARQALAKLQGIEPPDALDARGTTLRAEGEALLRVFAAWHEEPPIGEERSRAVERVLDLHRNVEQYLAERRGTGGG